MNTPPENPPPPEPGSQAAVGDKGASQIIEILSNVTTGMMERASAVNALVTVYGMTPEKAEEITPPQGKRPEPAKPDAPKGDK
jgi:hypothetical protein